MELLVQNWDLILITVVALAGLVFATLKWLSQPTSKQKEQIRTVLLQLVVTAEKLYGGNGTGRIKFSYVYASLLTHFSWLKYIPLPVVEELIEESLVVMRKLLESNSQVKKIVDGEK